MKTCTQCKEEQPDTDFIKMGMQRHSMCHPCRKKYNRDNYHRLKKRRDEYGQ